MSETKDLTGQRFGKLTALCQAEKPYPRVYWTCQCDCGSRVDVAANSLTSGHSKSCGCRKGIRYTGKRYGMLTVLEKTGKTVRHGQTKSPLWKCRCDCGNITFVRLNSLTSGSTRSCRKHTEEQLASLHKAAGYIDGTQVSRLRKIMEANAKDTAKKVIGVTCEKGKWRARIVFQGVTHNLGRDGTYEEAAAARRKAEQELFGSYLKTV